MNKDLKLDEVYFFAMEAAVRQFRKVSKQLFKDHNIDLNGEQWVILKRASEKEGLSQQQMAELTYKDPASMTRMLDQLEKKGYMERKAVEGDRRTFSLHITANGRTLVDKVTPLAKQMRAQGIKGLNKQEVSQLIQTLNRIEANLT